MQFYIIHEDPAENARLLPDYCLKKVNVREGYQILSDIGYIYGVTWEGQNKKYSTSHPTTRYHGGSREAFSKFVEYYSWCLAEYTSRYEKSTVFHSKFVKFRYLYPLLMDEIPSCAESYSDIHYLLTEKRELLTAEEIKRLEEMV